MKKVVSAGLSLAMMMGLCAANASAADLTGQNPSHTIPVVYRQASTYIVRVPDSLNFQAEDQEEVYDITASTLHLEAGKKLTVTVTGNKDTETPAHQGFKMIQTNNSDNVIEYEIKRQKDAVGTTTEALLSGAVHCSFVMSGADHANAATYLVNESARFKATLKNSASINSADYRGGLDFDIAVADI